MFFKEKLCSHWHGKTGCSIYKSLINSGAAVYFWEDNPKHSKKYQIKDIKSILLK